jgi:hypothetical protein
VKPLARHSKAKTALRERNPRHSGLPASRGGGTIAAKPRARATSSASHEPAAPATSSLKSYSDSLAIAERLAQSDPGHAGWQRDLSVSFGRLALVHKQSGDNAKALDFLRQGQAIMARLTKLPPDNATWKGDLARFDRELAARAKR